MISGCMIKIFRNYDGDLLEEEIRQYLSENDINANLKVSH